MSENAVRSILDVESEAAGIRDRAEAEAAQMVAEAERAAAVHREELMARAETQAKRIVADGQAAAAASRTQILEQADALASDAEAAAEQHTDRAVAYIVSRVVPRV